MRILVMTSLALSLSLLACGNKDSSSPTASSPLSGTFTTSCIVTGGSSYKAVQIFSGSSLTGSATYYADPACTAGQESMAVRITGNVSVGAAATTPAGSTKVDLSNLKMFVTLKSDDFVSAYNSTSQFGKNDWVKNTEKDVTGLSESGASEPTTRYDVFKLTGTTLCFGDEDSTNDGSSDAKRPQILESEAKCYKKQ